MRRIAETWIRLSSRYAPSPRAAHHRWPSAGAEATPTSDRPSRSSATSVAQIGIPRTKFRVPSIGSTTQRVPASSPPPSSPRKPSPGRRSTIAARSASSTARSASETGVRSTFVSTCRSVARKRGREIESARSASSCTKARSEPMRELRRLALSDDRELRLRDPHRDWLRPRHGARRPRQREVDPADAIPPDAGRERAAGNAVLADHLPVEEGGGGEGQLLVALLRQRVHGAPGIAARAPLDL